MTSKILKKKRPVAINILWNGKNYIRFTWEQASIMEDTVVLDEFEANLN